MRRQIWRLLPEAHQWCGMHAGTYSEKNILSGKQSNKAYSGITAPILALMQARFLALHYQQLGMEVE